MDDTPAEQVIERFMDWADDVDWNRVPVVIPIIVTGVALLIIIVFERSRYSFTGIGTTIDTD